MSEINLPDYSKYSLNELFDIYSRIDKISNAERFVALENEIITRTGLDRTDIEKQLNLSNTLNVAKPKKRNTKLLVICWILIIYSSFAFLSSFITTITSLFIGGSNLIDIVEGSISPISEFLITHIYVTQLPTLIISSLFILFAIGLFKNKESSRENIVYLLWFAMFWNIVWSFFIDRLVTSVILENNTLMPMRSFSTSASMVSSIIFNLFIAAIIGYFIYELSSREIKKEFK